MRALLALVLAASAISGAPPALAHDAPTLRVEVRREGRALNVRVDADAAVWALAPSLSRRDAAARAVSVEDDAGRPCAVEAVPDGDAVVLCAAVGDDALVRLSLFGTDAAGEAVLSIDEPEGRRILRVELPGAVCAPASLPAGDAVPAERPRVDAISFVAWGVEHVLTGWDHLAFLLTLVVVSRGVRDAVRVATAFTLAHSTTLSLAAFDVVRLPSAPVEAAIAATIVVAAARNVLRPASTGRTAVAFGFGLVHGLGFSSALADVLGGASASRALAVAAFNGGVELGQAAAIAATLPLLLAWRRRCAAGYARFGLRGLSLAAGVLGLVWLVARGAALA